MSKRQTLYGIPLYQIAVHDEYSSVNAIGDDRRFFQVNDENYMLVKHASQNCSPWRFTLTNRDLERLHGLNFFKNPYVLNAYLVLICGEQKICAVKPSEWSSLFDEKRPYPEQQSLKVEQPPGCQMQLSSENKKLDNSIPASRFPDVLFEEGE